MKANPNFETETSWTYEIGGLKDVTEDTKFRAAFYYTDISDYQQHNYIRAAPSALVYNIDMVVYGIELELSRSFRQDLSGYLTYTYQDWNADDPPMKKPENNHYLLQNQPRHKAVLGLDYKLWEGGVVNFDVKYIGKRRNKMDDRMDDEIIVNVGAQHTFEFQHDCDLTLKGWVNNVTDQDYQLRYGYDMPGTTAGISASMSF